MINARLFPRLGRRRRTLSFLLPLYLALLAGCGEKNELNRQALSGTVALNGTPVAVGTIRFTPEAQTGVSSGGPIADGKFAIRAAEGLPPGKYIVRIYATQKDSRTVEQGGPPGPATEKPGVDLIPPRYNARSELVREVTADAENKFDFDLQSAQR